MKSYFYLYGLWKAKIPTIKRIGPHNRDYFSVLIGNLLGDGHSELRSGNLIFYLHMSGGHMEYLLLATCFLF